MIWLVLYFSVGACFAVSLLARPRAGYPWGLYLGEMAFSLVAWPVHVGYYACYGAYDLALWVRTWWPWAVGNDGLTNRERRKYARQAEVYLSRPKDTEEMRLKRLAWTEQIRKCDHVWDGERPLGQNWLRKQCVKCKVTRLKRVGVH